MLAWSAALLLGLALRAVPLAAARPYIAYVDEGNFLHAVFGMLRDGGWDPREYLYPQFPRLVVTAAGRSLESAREAAGLSSLRRRIPRTVENYDHLEPFGFLLLARCLSVGIGLAIVVLTGRFASRLSGPVAGASAAVLAALVPALALRGSIASVDSYATLAVLGCLDVTDRSRTSSRPAAAVLGAGALAGVAGASKYPAVMVLVALVVTTALIPIPLRQKAGRVVIAIVGTVLGAFVAMPALFRHAAEIPHVLQVHRAGYAQFVSDPSLWRQALVEAESTLRYRGPEVGTLFCLLAAVGFGVGVRRRSLAPTLLGWCAAAISFLALFGSQGSRPFRNLLPLVPVGCICAAIGFDAIRSRFRSHGWVDLVACGTIAVSWGWPMAAHVRSLARLEDSRRTAIDWLAAHARPSDGVVIARELAILDGEIARVPGRVTRVPWSEAEARIRAEKPRFVVAGVLMRPDHSLDPSADWPALVDYRGVLQAGETPTVPFREWWHGNDQIVTLYERRAPE